MKIRHLTFALLALIALPSAVSAHVPTLVGDDKVVTISDPEVSQVFYGELRGEPVRFRIVSDQPFRLHLSALVPDMPDADKDFSIAVMKDGSPWLLADSSKVEWKTFHESFANDDYFSGPELAADASAGTYDIALFSPDNIGKYAFSVGDKEAFGPGAVMTALRTLPEIKMAFFGKSWVSAYTNRVGLMIAFPFVVLALLVGAALFIFKRKMATVLPKEVPLTPAGSVLTGRVASMAYRSGSERWKRGKGIDSTDKSGR